MYRRPRRRLRGLLLGLTGLALVAGFLTGAVLLEDRYAELEANGHRIPATVVEVHPGYRGLGDAVDVRFRHGAEERVRSLNLDDTSPAFQPGDALTVLQHPDDPERLAAPGVNNDPTWATILVVLALVCGLVLVLAGVVDLFRRR